VCACVCVLVLIQAQAYLLVLVNTGMPAHICVSISIQIFSCSLSSFVQTLKEFLCFAEAEVRSLASLYSGVVGFKTLLGEWC
jgi:hypothetical protein